MHAALWRGIADSLASMSVETALTLAYETAIVRNLVTARRYNLRLPELGPLADSVPSAADYQRWNDPAISGLRTGLAMAAQLSAANPMVSAAFGAASSLLGSMPTPIGPAAADVFSRWEPVLERVRIAGSEDEPPEWNPPALPEGPPPPVRTVPMIGGMVSVGAVPPPSMPFLPGLIGIVDVSTPPPPAPADMIRPDVSSGPSVPVIVGSVASLAALLAVLRFLVKR
jgi:hypothetical protein